MTGHAHAAHEREDNSHAGQGAVLLDIGADIGALVVTMPAGLIGREVEIRPYGHDGVAHLPHVAVVNRPRDGRHGPPVASAVFGELEAGDYDLYLRPNGPVELSLHIEGGAVAFADWPTQVTVP